MRQKRKLGLYIGLVLKIPSVNLTQIYSLFPGRNHIILNLSSKMFNSSERVVPSAATGRAIIAQSSWRTNDYRQGHDIVIPPVVGPPGGETWMESPYMLPARRKYLLSFQGYASDSSMSEKDNSDASQSKILE